MYQSISKKEWQEELPTFKEACHKFYNEELSRAEYKGISGKFGSYAQKDGSVSMLRLRMTAGRMTKEKLNFICEAITKYDVNMMHFTTCEALQLHNLNETQVVEIMEEALDVDIITIGGGGDFPRNVMCSPLSGVEVDEYFNVMPYAIKAADYLLTFVNQEKLPRKLKVCFSSSPTNVPHATYRDLGFVAREDQKFDVYSAGGLGNNPKFGVKVAEAVDPSEILYYIKAMVLTFRTYGNYENRAKARTRYMQEALGGAEKYKEAYLEKLAIAKEEDLTISVDPITYNKQPDGNVIAGKRIVKQSNGLYAVKWHPIGGQPSKQSLINLNNTIKDMDDVEVRLSADETAYIINLNAKEAKSVIEATPDHASTQFEYSVSCIGSSVCQVGLRDSQALLNACVQKVRDAKIKDGALPAIHISGCPSSCGTHQTNILSFRGGMKMVDKKPLEAFLLYVGGCDQQGKEKMAEEIGAIETKDIPDFLVEVGKAVMAANQSYVDWYTANPDTILEIAKKYL